MQVLLAKSAGFCYGVRRAVELAEKMVTDGEQPAMLGPVIHNSQVIEDLCNRGARLIQRPEEAKPGETEDDAELLTACCAHIASAHSLSARERDVLEQLARGSNRADIGRILVLSEETVKTHIRHIYRKCSIHSRQELKALISVTRDELENDRMNLAQYDTFE